MSRILTTLLILAFVAEVKSQVYHSCPAHLPSGDAYENPLYDKWLSAYDVKHYLLSLEVSNTNTRIAGTAEVIVEARREMDTLVLELQDGLDVTGIMYSDNLADSGYPAIRELMEPDEDRICFRALSPQAFLRESSGSG